MKIKSVKLYTIYKKLFPHNHTWHDQTSIMCISSECSIKMSTNVDIYFLLVKYIHSDNIINVPSNITVTKTIFLSHMITRNYH